MSKLQSKLDERLNYIKSLVLDMGGLVEKTISDSGAGLLKDKSNNQFLEKLQKREEKINTFHLKIARSCFKNLAREGPVARDLRLILAIINANTDLERMGDLAFNIAAKAQVLQRDPLLETSFKLFEKMFLQVIKMTHESLSAFVEGDEKLAHEILFQDDIVDHIRDDIRSHVEQICSANVQVIKPCIDLITIAGDLERIADHVTNIAEEVIFLETGDDIRHQHGSDSEEN